MPGRYRAGKAENPKVYRKRTIGLPRALLAAFLPCPPFCFHLQTTNIFTMTDEPIPVPIRRWPGSEDLPLPGYQSAHAAGMDLHAGVSDQTVIEPGTTQLIPCGFAMAVPDGFEAQIRPRSGLAVKHSISIPNTPGTIDSDYRGQVCVPLINHGATRFVVTRGMRIAQMVVKPVPRVRWQEVGQLPETDRGDGGFGHTGS